MMNKALQNFARRAATQAKNIKPKRGGDGVPYKNEYLTKDHKGAWGPEYGTGYLPVGNTPGQKLKIGGGLFGLVFVGVGAVMWSAWRQGQWD
eukprot:CAMPEP_0181295154 /NCGR_PEP_ID=MMETSP1101-20121128/3990_1 /TAXON_ID=46948 /ORGANISM="Rhodomonas abbreviata, Strain Caron Lab Isolate" /LENGTH=91 /DNA_ID=CAMNT_0023399875 /DNA_START=21 /DNA_END=296 /DNA_ORIENTATION=+